MEHEESPRARELGEDHPMREVWEHLHRQHVRIRVVRNDVDELRHLEKLPPDAEKALVADSKNLVGGGS